MFRKELIVPALLGLGLYAQNSEINLANNTSILLILYLLLDENHEHHDHHEHRDCGRDEFLPFRRFDGCPCKCC